MTNTYAFDSREEQDLFVQLFSEALSAYAGFWRERQPKARMELTEKALNDLKNGVFIK